MRIAEAVDWYLAGTDRSGRGGPPRGSRRGARKGKAGARPWPEPKDFDFSYGADKVI